MEVGSDPRRRSIGQRSLADGDSEPGAGLSDDADGLTVPERVVVEELADHRIMVPSTIRVSTSRAAVSNETGEEDNSQKTISPAEYLRKAHCLPLFKRKQLARTQTRLILLDFEQKHSNKDPTVDDLINHRRHLADLECLATSNDGNWDKRAERSKRWINTCFEVKQSGYADSAHNRAKITAQLEDYKEAIFGEEYEPPVNITPSTMEDCCTVS